MLNVFIFTTKNFQLTNCARRPDSEVTFWGFHCAVEKKVGKKMGERSVKKPECFFCEKTYRVKNALGGNPITADVLEPDRPRDVHSEVVKNS